jgi:hypothetical protein
VRVRAHANKRLGDSLASSARETRTRVYPNFSRKIVEKKVVSLDSLTTDHRPIRYYLVLFTSHGSVNTSHIQLDTYGISDALGLYFVLKHAYESL